MDLATAIRTRRSEQHLIDPAPSDAEFIELLGCAALSPDHGRLRPWRWVLLRDEARAELGMRFGRDSGDAARAGRTAAKPLRAPLLATLVFSPQLAARIPRWEQLSAAVAVANAMMLLLHDRGYGSIWRTGAHTRSPGARDLLGLDSTESLLGWLYIGTPDPQKHASPRVTAPVCDKVTAVPPQAARRKNSAGKEHAALGNERDRAGPAGKLPGTADYRWRFCHPTAR